MILCIDRVRLKDTKIKGENMSIYAIGEVIVSDLQKQKVMQYLLQTNDDPDRVNNEQSLRHYIGILEAFGNDVDLAVKTNLDAGRKASDAMIKHSFEMYKLPCVPFPKEKNPLRRFHTVEQGQAYWEKVKAESWEVYKTVFNNEFNDIVRAHHDKFWNTPHTCQ